MLDDWAQVAGQIEHALVQAFIERLRFFEHVIFNRTDYPIGASGLETTNTNIKIKVVK